VSKTKRGDISDCSNGKPCDFFLVVLDTIESLSAKFQLSEFFFTQKPFNAPTIGPRLGKP
jgi:hypothetical protein